MAPERWTFEELAAAGWSEDDLRWEQIAEAALEHLAAGDLPGSAEKSAEALRIAHQSFAENDPRLGTSLANQGAVLVSGGEAHLAGRTLADALRIWERADTWIAKLTAPRVARSSLFHLRMEQRHRPAYEARWRMKWAELADEGRTLVTGGELTLVSTAGATERLARWRRERPAMLNDTRKLMGAVLLLVCRRAS